VEKAGRIYPHYAGVCRNCHAVSMPACAPVNDIAGQPAAVRAETSATEDMISPHAAIASFLPERERESPADSANAKRGVLSSRGLVSGPLQIQLPQHHCPPASLRLSLTPQVHKISRLPPRCPRTSEQQSPCESPPVVVERQSYLNSIGCSALSELIADDPKPHGVGSGPGLHATCQPQHRPCLTHGQALDTRTSADRPLI